MMTETNQKKCQVEYVPQVSSKQKTMTSLSTNTVPAPSPPLPLPPPPRSRSLEVSKSHFPHSRAPVRACVKSKDTVELDSLPTRDQDRR